MLRGLRLVAPCHLPSPSPSWVSISARLYASSTAKSRASTLLHAATSLLRARATQQAHLLEQQQQQQQRPNDSIPAEHPKARLAMPKKLLSKVTQYAKRYQWHAQQPSASSAASTTTTATPASTEGSQPQQQQQRDKGPSYRQRLKQAPFNPRVLEKVVAMRLGKNITKLLRKSASDARKADRGERDPHLSLKAVSHVRSHVVPQSKHPFRVGSLRFYAGAATPQSFPPDIDSKATTPSKGPALPRLPEIAFIGRSNVGKSSLINAITSSGGVRVSPKPGLTKTINWFQLQLNPEHELVQVRLVDDVEKQMPLQVALVDLPGYGYAFASEEKSAEWNETVIEYLRSRKALKILWLLLDSRHGLKSADRQFLRTLKLHKVPFRIVLTKGDLVHAEDLVRQHSMLHQELDGEFAHALSHGIYMVSSSTRAGIDTIQREITSVALNHARKLRRSAMAQSHAVVAKQAAPKTPKTPPSAPAAARTTNQTATKRAAKRPPSPSS